MGGDECRLVEERVRLRDEAAVGSFVVEEETGGMEGARRDVPLLGRSGAGGAVLELFVRVDAADAERRNAEEGEMVGLGTLLGLEDLDGLCEISTFATSETRLVRDLVFGCWGMGRGGAGVILVGLVRLLSELARASRPLPRVSIRRKGHTFQ